MDVSDTYAVYAICAYAGYWSFAWAEWLKHAMDAGNKLRGTPALFDVTDLGSDSKIGPADCQDLSAEQDNV